MARVLLYGSTKVSGNEEKVHLVGSSGGIWSLDRKTGALTKHKTGTETIFFDVWDDGKGLAIAVGALIAKYDDSGQWITSTGLTSTLRSIWGSSADNIVAVGDQGTIRYCDGSVWFGEMDSGTNDNLTAVWGSGPDNILAVGRNGTVLKYDGAKWSELDLDTKEADLSAIWGSGPDDIYLAGSTVMLHYDGKKWTKVEGWIHEVKETLEDWPTFAFSNGNGLKGDGTSTAKGTSIAEAAGVVAGDGENWIVNRGQITVEARPDASVDARADGDAWGDAIGTVVGHGRAASIGILSGDGNNRIQNDGTIVVSAVSTAEASARVSGGDICIWFFKWWCGGGGKGKGSESTALPAYEVGSEEQASHNYRSEYWRVHTSEQSIKPDCTQCQPNIGITFPTK